MVISQLKIVKTLGEGIIPYLADLARLRIQVFREYPYLYEGDITYEENYLKRFANCKDSVLVLVMDDQKIVGASTALPLSAEIAEIQAPFVKNHMDLNSLFYSGESVLLPEYRGLGIYRRFFEMREAAAKAYGSSQTVFLAVVREKDHPAKPINYQSLEKIWEHFGYKAQPHLLAYFEWKEIGENESSTKPMMAWMKSL